VYYTLIFAALLLSNADPGHCAGYFRRRPHVHRLLARSPSAQVVKGTLNNAPVEEGMAGTPVRATEREREGA